MEINWRRTGKQKNQHSLEALHTSIPTIRVSACFQVSQQEKNTLKTDNLKRLEKLGRTDVFWTWVLKADKCVIASADDKIWKATCSSVFSRLPVEYLWASGPGGQENWINKSQSVCILVAFRLPLQCNCHRLSLVEFVECVTRRRSSRGRGWQILTSGPVPSWEEPNIQFSLYKAPCTCKTTVLSWAWNQDFGHGGPDPEVTSLALAALTPCSNIPETSFFFWPEFWPDFWSGCMSDLKIRTFTHLGSGSKFPNNTPRFHILRFRGSGPLPRVLPLCPPLRCWGNFHPEQGDAVGRRRDRQSSFAESGGINLVLHGSAATSFGKSCSFPKLQPFIMEMTRGLRLELSSTPPPPRWGSQWMTARRAGESGGRTQEWLNPSGMQWAATLRAGQAGRVTWLTSRVSGWRKTKRCDWLTELTPTAVNFFDAYAWLQYFFPFCRGGNKTALS